MDRHLARRSDPHEALIRGLAGQSLAADRKRLSRQDCLRWLARHDYPIPPKSACIGCPFHSDAYWRRMRDNDPDAWGDAVLVDRAIRTGFRGIRGEVFLHRSAVPLDQADISNASDRGQLDLWPNECEGMASGISGTMRFTGLVVGIAALGVVLYGRVEATVASVLPQTNAADRQALVQAITAGHLSATTLPGGDPTAIKKLAVASFASGYQWLFFVGAVFMVISTILTSILVSADETPPVSAPVRRINGRQYLGMGRRHHPGMDGRLAPESASCAWPNLIPPSMALRSNRISIVR